MRHSCQKRLCNSAAGGIHRLAIHQRVLDHTLQFMADEGRVLALADQGCSADLPHSLGIEHTKIGRHAGRNASDRKTEHRGRLMRNRTKRTSQRDASLFSPAQGQGQQ